MRKILKMVLPEHLWKSLRAVMKPLFAINKKRESYLIKVQYERNKIILDRIRKKPIITVAFFSLHSSVWKYDELYRLMVLDSRFEPVIVVCPVINYGRKYMLSEMDKTYEQFKSKNYNVIKAYNKSENSYLDVKREISPDIIFYTNPHRLTMKKYYITNYSNSLSCYSQYSFHITHLNELQYNLLFHNLLWKAFYETDIHKKLAVKYSRNRGQNVVVTGFPGIDPLISKKIDRKDVWKINDKNVKRIIWAPHHSIDDREELSYSNFINYHQILLNIAEQYQNKIQIAFKPHPILMQKLIDYPEWGLKRTEDYYQQWANLENGQLETGDYIDLFNTSDAMILDSASFMVEYLYCGKPSLFTVSSTTINERFNQFGKMSFAQHYHAYNATDIYDFIDNVVCQGNDPMKEERESFYVNNLIPPNNKTASENIMAEMSKELS